MKEPMKHRCRVLAVVALVAVGVFTSARVALAQGGGTATLQGVVFDSTAMTVRAGARIANDGLAALFKARRMFFEYRCHSADCDDNKYLKCGFDVPIVYIKCSICETDDFKYIVKVKFGICLKCKNEHYSLFQRQLQFDLSFID